jgi:hypothetical protein
MGKKYLNTPNFSTNSLGLTTSKKFIQRAREKKSKGDPDYPVWVRAARILHHIEHNQPVGASRRKYEQWLRARRCA